MKKVAKVVMQTRVPPDVKKCWQLAANRRRLPLHQYLCNFLSDPTNHIVAVVPAVKPRKILVPAVVLDKEMLKVLANLGDTFDQIARSIYFLHGRDELQQPIYYLGKLLEAQKDLHRLVNALSTPKGI